MSYMKNRFNLQYFADGEPEELGQQTDTQQEAAETGTVDVDNMTDEQIEAYLKNHADNDTDTPEEAQSDAAPEATKTQQTTDETQADGSTDGQPVNWEERYKNLEQNWGKQGTELHELRRRNAELAEKMAEFEARAVQSMTEDERMDMVSDPQKFEELLSKKVQAAMKIEKLKGEYQTFKTDQQRETVKAELKDTLEAQDMDKTMQEIIDHTKHLVETKGAYTPESFEKFKKDPYNPIYRNDIVVLHKDLQNKRLQEKIAQLETANKTGKESLIEKLNKAGNVQGKSAAMQPGATGKDWTKVSEADLDKMTEAEEIEFLRARGAIT